MKTFLRQVLMFTLVLSMVSGMVGTTASAQEVHESIVIGGSQKLLLEVGTTYDIPVSFLKADGSGDDSMAKSALTGATLTANADGTVTVEFKMINTTIMGFWGFAETLALNNTHEAGATATSMTIASTFTKKLGTFTTKTYTIPDVFSSNMPYLDQNGVYAQMALNTGAGSMNQEGYFSFDFASIRADYSAVDAAIAKVPSDLSIYTEETASMLSDVVSEVELYYHEDRQAEVNTMAFAIEAALEGLVEDPTIRVDAEVSGTVLATPSTFTVNIPESIELGTLSILDDTVVAYSLGVDMIEGNDGKLLEVTITGGSNEKLVYGNNEISLLNSLTSYTFANSEVIDETITVEASVVNMVYHGEYQGTMTFYIDSEYIAE